MTNRLCCIRLVVLLICFTASLSAEDLVLRPGSPDQVNLSAKKLKQGVRLFERAVQHAELRGAVLLVARRGRIVLHEAIGWRDKERALPMKRDTLFKMASNTKPVVATAVLMLAEQGKLDLDDNVRAHVPSWDNYRAGYIKIRHLLCHTSGLRIPGVFLTPLLAKSEDNPDAPSLRAEVDRFGRIGAREVPGTTYSYNNPGYQALGRLVEVAGQMPLAEYLRRNIYEPLEMHDSWNHETNAPHERMACVTPRKGGVWETRWTPGDPPDWPFVRGSGGMISSALDYATFCQMYLNGGIYAGKRILKSDSVSEATKIQTGSVYTAAERAARDRFYGLGWSVDKEGVFGHGGSDGTQAWVDPRRQLIILVFTQSPGGKNPREEFRRLMTEACLDMPHPESSAARPRVRDLGIQIGVLPTGPLNAITDVDGVRVGHETIHAKGSIRTGVTAVLPHNGNLFQEKVAAAFHVANGFGKFVGSTQIEELGVLESPIVMTNTLSTFAAADALVAWSLWQPGNERVRSVNPVVGECNDGFLNDIRAQVVKPRHVEQAIQSAASGPVAEGCLGAGTGTRCLGWKGGIGTASRRLPSQLGGYTIGVLIQTNFGGQLTIAGAPVGRELGRYYLQDMVRQHEDGSCIVIVATDAPLDARRLGRLARRAPLGLAAAGSSISHGSGDYVLAFSTHPSCRSSFTGNATIEPTELLRDDALSPLFQAVREATEEAVVNSMLKATTTRGQAGRVVEAIDPEDVLRVCREFGVVGSS